MDVPMCQRLPRVANIQAYLGYYVASKLRLFTPGPIQGISIRDGCYLAMGCLPLNIANRYFILREWIHQYNGRGRYRSGISHGCPSLGHRQACMDQRRYRRGLFRIDKLGASDRCRTGLFESYWRLRAWSCDLIGQLASAWSQRRNPSGCLQAQQQPSQRSAVGCTSTRRPAMFKELDGVRTNMRS
jgi:hypothetical protein